MLHLTFLAYSSYNLELMTESDISSYIPSFCLVSLVSSLIHPSLYHTFSFSYIPFFSFLINSFSPSFIRSIMYSSHILSLSLIHSFSLFILSILFFHPSFNFSFVLLLISLRKKTLFTVFDNYIFSLLFLRLFFCTIFT